MWWPLWMPWSDLRWWTPPGTCTWARQSRPQPWPPGRPARAGWASTQEAGCLVDTSAPHCTCSLWPSRYSCRKTLREGRWRGTRWAKVSAGLGGYWPDCAGTPAGRGAEGAGRGRGRGSRTQGRLTETWLREIPAWNGRRRARQRRGCRSGEGRGEAGWR